MVMESRYTAAELMPQAMQPNLMGLVATRSQRTRPAARAY
jgi:hypothetical protein